ncbi:MAG: pyridoxamine 5'-phosphate oxidase [Bacteroidota bacterium]
MSNNKEALWALRRDYQSQSLDIHEVADQPIAQFTRWFEEAKQSEVIEPNAMTLATCNADGRPSARVVLLKEYDEGGFVFYTNYQSRKGQELAENPYGALNFCWLELERQIRIEGTIRRVSAERSKRYFQIRPKGSQIGAWASPQSQVIPNRAVLEERVKNLEKDYADVEQLPLPPHWGGFILEPDWMEFWQGRSSRLHDRIAYRQDTVGNWQKERLAP